MPRWLGWIVAATVAVAVFVLVLREARDAGYIVAWFLMGIVWAKLATESARRLHDSGQAGGWLVAIAAGVGALLLASLLRRMSHGADGFSMILAMAAAVLVAVAFLRPGTYGANRYGEQPMTLPSSQVSGSTVGSIVAIAIVLCSTGLGVAFSAWLDAADRARAERLRIGEAVQRDLDQRKREGRSLREDVPSDTAADPTSNRIEELLNNRAAS